MLLFQLSLLGYTIQFFSDESHFE